MDSAPKSAFEIYRAQLNKTNVQKRKSGNKDKKLKKRTQRSASNTIGIESKTDNQQQNLAEYSNSEKVCFKSIV